MSTSTVPPTSPFDNLRWSDLARLWEQVAANHRSLAVRRYAEQQVKVCRAMAAKWEGLVRS